MKRLLLALCLSACAGAHSARVAQPAVTPEPVIAAERAFAADGAQRGWIAAFRSYAAADAMTLSPGPVNAQENLAQAQGDGGTNLAWGPTYAGVSRAGDFGFTTGPFWLRNRDGVIGHYFTVWRKQPDGSWKWIFDAGTDVSATERAAETGAIPTLPVSTSAAGGPQAASDEVRRIETQIAAGGALAGGALSRYLASDARVNHPGSAPGIGRQAGLALIRQTQGLG